MASSKVRHGDLTPQGHKAPDRGKVTFALPSPKARQASFPGACRSRVVTFSSSLNSSPEVSLGLVTVVGSGWVGFCFMAIVVERGGEIVAEWGAVSPAAPSL